MQGFLFKRNKLYCENVPVEAVCQKIKTPFYLYSSKTILNNFDKLSNNLKGCNYLIAYSVKANSNISILRLLAKKGSGADVVSLGELTRALKAGISPRKIVFSGVGKTDVEISNAVEKKILQFNVESQQELLTIEKISRQKRLPTKHETFMVRSSSVACCFAARLGGFLGRRRSARRLRSNSFSSFNL